MGEEALGALAAAASWFFLLHMLPSTPLRPRAVAIAGEGAYTAIFSIISLIAIYWLWTQFNAAPYGDKLWRAPDWWRWVQAALVLFSFVLMFGGLLTPNPSAPGGAEVLSNTRVADGIFAITRHPVMWGVAIWAITHMISQATWRGFAFFGAFAATALIGSWLQQNRKRDTVPGWADFEAKTSFWPFLAISQGRAKFSLSALGWWRIAIAVVAWAAILHFHSWLFGAHPLPLSA
jgi:uncharacterized membrane protein